MKKFILLFISFMFLSANLVYAQQRQIKPVQLTIGTGDKNGSLYLIGISIGKILNINSKIHKLNPNVMETEGAVYNIDKIIKSHNGKTTNEKR